MHTQLLISKSRTSGSVHEDKYFWIFPHRGLNNLTLGLPDALNSRSRPSISYLEWYILSLLDTLKEEKLERKETIAHCCLTCYAWVYIPLSLWTTQCCCPNLSFSLWAFHWEMENWSGGGTSGGLNFSGSKKCRQRLSLLYLYSY